jgi:hypothetical protein
MAAGQCRRAGGLNSSCTIAWRYPDEFLAVRRPELWLAATVHAAFRLHPGEVRRGGLTLQDLADICGVSVASISKRSRQLREGVRVEWRKA